MKSKNPMSKRIDDILNLKQTAVIQKRGYIDRRGIQNRGEFSHFKNRTIDFYIRKGILKKGKQIDINDRRVFWKRDYIIDELKSIEILSSYGLTLSDIASLAEATDHNLKSLIDDFVEIVETYLDNKRKRSRDQKKDTTLVCSRDALEVVMGFCSFILKKKKLLPQDLDNFKKRVKEYEEKEIQVEELEEKLRDPSDDAYMQKVNKKLLEDFKKEAGHTSGDFFTQ